MDRAAVKGFTLAELLAAVALGALVMLGFAAILPTLFTLQVNLHKKDLIQVHSIQSLEQLTRSVRATTEFTSPPAPCPFGDCAGSVNQDGAVLVGCSNYDRNWSGYRLDTFRAVTVCQFCVDTGGRMWYAWKDITPPPPLPATCPAGPACGNPFAGGGAGGTEILAQRVSPDGAFPYFRRPANLNNVVELHYVVGSGTAAVVINTSVAASKQVRSMNP